MTDAASRELAEIALALKEIKAELVDSRAEIRDLRAHIESITVSSSASAAVLGSRFVSGQSLLREIRESIPVDLTPDKLRELRRQGYLAEGYHYRDERRPGAKKPSLTYHPKRVAKLLNTDRSKWAVTPPPTT